MRRILSIAILTTTIAAVPLFSTAAEAHTCNHACSGWVRVCTGMAMRAANGCAYVCNATFAADPAARRSCHSDCRDTAMADKAVCDGSLADCRDTCALAADPKCADAVCSYSFGDCREAVRRATSDCVTAAGTDGAAIQACIEPGDAMTGLGRAALAECELNMATGLVACIGGC